MPDSDRAGLGDRLVSQTGSYLDLTADCVASLPALLSAYPDGGYDGGVKRVPRLESKCDRLHVDAITAAFDNTDGAAALFCRELAAALDSIVDAMEDVTDRMVCTTGSDLPPTRNRK